MAPKKITFIPVDIKELYAAAKPRSAKKKAAKKIRKVLDYEHSDGEEEPKRLPTVEEEPQEVVNLDQLSIKEEPQEPQPVVEIPKPAPIEPPLRRLRKKYVDSSDDEEPNYECLLAWGARKDREEIESFEFPVLKPPTLNDTFDFWVREKTYFSVFLMGEDSIHLKLDPGMFVFSEIKEALRDLGALKHKYMLRCREQFLDHYTFMDFIDQERVYKRVTHLQVLQIHVWEAIQKEELPTAKLLHHVRRCRQHEKDVAEFGHGGPYIGEHGELLENDLYL